MNPIQSFSLILATVGRTTCIQVVLASLEAQTFKNFDILLIDQNEPGYLTPVLEPFLGRLDIRVFRSAPGLSKARNEGLLHLSGDAFALVDDDCAYEPDTLEKAAAALSSTDIAIGVALPLPASPDEAAVPPEHHPAVCETVRTVFWNAPSITLFFRSHIVPSVGFFDENMGAGSGTHFGSGEETDYVIRAIRAGYMVIRDASIKVRHPLLDHTSSIAKAKTYGHGRRFLIKKHTIGTGFLWLNILYSFYKMVSSFPHWGAMRWHWGMFLGRLGY
jgi:Predicted glycosyltransferases